MTFNPAAAKTIFKVRDYLPDEFSLIDLGTQTLSFDPGVEGVKTTEDFYASIGCSKYDSIDTDGRGTVNLDLNKQISECPQYDCVVNSGTGEHIFDQGSVFRNVHALCKPGGIMVHILPWINWLNHGFYSFHPILFHDLARANHYKTMAIYACDRNGENGFEVPLEEIKKPDAIDKNFFICVIMKKKWNNPFAIPQQSKYDKFYDVKEIRNAFQWPKEINLKPYPHFVAKIDDALYEQLAKEFPERSDKFQSWGGNTKESNNVLEQYSAREALFDNEVSPLWKAFMEYTVSGHFFQEVLKAFSPHIQGAYPVTQLPLETGIRGLENAPFTLDSQFAINTPVAKKSSVRGPHVDSPDQLIGGLFYFTPPGYDSGGDLGIYKWKGKREFVGRRGMKKKAECATDAVELVGQIPYEPNTLLFFLNGPDSIHGVLPRERSGDVRRYMNWVAHVEKPLFELK